MKLRITPILLQFAGRLRYMRILERFVRSVIGCLVKEENATFGGFKGKVTKQASFDDGFQRAAIQREASRQQLRRVGVALGRTAD